MRRWKAMHDMDEQDLQKVLDARTKAAARHIVRGLLEGLEKAEIEMHDLSFMGGPKTENVHPYVAYVVLQFSRELQRLQERVKISPRYRWQESDIRAVLHGLGLELYWLDDDLQLDFDPLKPEEL